MQRHELQNYEINVIFVRGCECECESMWLLKWACSIECSTISSSSLLNGKFQIPKCFFIPLPSISGEIWDTSIHFINRFRRKNIKFAHTIGVIVWKYICNHIWQTICFYHFSMNRIENSAFLGDPIFTTYSANFYEWIIISQSLVCVFDWIKFCHIRTEIYSSCRTSIF